ncbi:MAG: arylsulfatase [Verrucomicrobiae bacterium]|nr:arylsulfatase [Verrucomicrobiae bacterium]
MNRLLLRHGLAVLLGVMSAGALPAWAAGRPNVILILTDDQGYGDIAAHGHPHLITPNMDRLRAMGVSLSNFHVDPTCSPTRAALMTGRYSARVGVWHTIMGRNLLRADETTVAEVFRRAGYRTGIFGKWHLGDNAPYGARFRGFEDAIVHGGGGVGQTPDYWGNDYFEDHYNDNGSWRRFQGYCTDVWFREALRFIRESGTRPFFLYLPTNAAHQTRPHVAERYRALYEGLDVPEAARIFWGMITNLDDNLGVLLDRLGQWGLLENTVLVFMGDNGTTLGPGPWPVGEREAWNGRYNVGMRGAKGSQYEGGHRAFCYIHYAAGGMAGGREVPQLTAHLDIMPTLLEICGIPVPQDLALDGRSLVPLLRGEYAGWPERTLVVHNQRVLDPVRWKQTSVMTDRWRLVDDRELYDIAEDPGQRLNRIAEHPEVAARLRGFYEGWWKDVGARFHEAALLHVGSERQNPVQLDAHDWMTADGDPIPPWNQPHIVQRPLQNGPWRVRVERAGHYAFTLRERPEVAGFVLTAERARLKVGEWVDETRTVRPGSTGVRFLADLPEGDAEVRTWLMEAGGRSRGAYYVEVEHLGGR